MHHLAAFYASIAQNSAYAALPGVADGALPRNGASQYVMPANMQVVAAFAQGVTTSRCQIQAPSLRNLAYPEVYPIQQSALDPTVTNAPIQLYGANGPRLLKNESLTLAASENNTGASPTFGGLWLAERFTPAPGGQIITLVATTTNVLVAQAWTLSTLAFETVLAVGTYMVVGMEIVCGDASLARLVFPGDTGMRPGCIAYESYGFAAKYNQFRVGNLGAWGEFEFNAPPQIEIFGGVAGSEAATVFLDVVKIR